MSAANLLRDLRAHNVEVSTRDGYLDLDAPQGVLTDEIVEAVTKAKPELLKLLAWERRKLDEADQRGLVIKYACEPGWIALHDPTTGEWHEVRVSTCLPSIVEAAKTNARRKKATR